MFITFSECWRRLDHSFLGTDSGVLSIKVGMNKNVNKQGTLKDAS